MAVQEPADRGQVVADLDGDGCAEKLVGMPRACAEGASTGSVGLVSGRTGRTIVTLTGDSASDRFGWSIAKVGDLNGDGVVDFAVGAPLADPHGNASGSAYAYSGKDGSLIHHFKGKVARNQFGYTVAASGDGCPDIEIGSPMCDRGGRNAGCKQIRSGRTGKILRTVYGKFANQKLGSKRRYQGSSTVGANATVITGFLARVQQ